MEIWFIVFTGILLSFIVLLTKPKITPQPFLSVKFHLNPKLISPKRTFLLFGFLNILILIGTSVFWHHYKTYNESFNVEAPIWLRFGLNQFNLATENVSAVWYSSMLMLFTSIACLFCFALEKNTLSNKRSRVFSYGWLFLSVLFIGLSADEMGSWHESFLMIDFSHYLPMSWMNVLTIPIGTIGLLMAAFFWLHLRTKKTSFMLMISGLLLYLSNPLLERTELALAAQGLTQLNSLLWAEEGGEIFGSLCFLVAALSYAKQLKGTTVKIPLTKLVLPVISFGALISVIFWAVNVYPNYLPRGDVGIAQNWFPATLFMLTTLISVDFFFKKRQFTYLSTAFFSLINSVYYGSNILGWIYNLDKLKIITHSVLIFLAIIASTFLARTINSFKYTVLCSVWLIFYAYSLNISPTYSQFTDVYCAYIFLLIHIPLYRK